MGNRWVSLQSNSRHTFIPTIASSIFGIRSQGWKWHWRRHQTWILRQRWKGLPRYRYDIYATVYTIFFITLLITFLFHNSQGCKIKGRFLCRKVVWEYEGNGHKWSHPHPYYRLTIWNWSRWHQRGFRSKVWKESRELGSSEFIWLWLMFFFFFYVLLVNCFPVKKWQITDRH